MFSADSAASTLLSYNINNGIFALFARTTSILLPYMAGKLLIENQEIDGKPMRKVLVQRMVVLLAIVAAISVLDFVTGHSTWQRAFKPLFPSQYIEWPEQVRWGFGRIAGPFAHAILAGMVFLAGLVYCLWLLWADRTWGTRPLLSGFPLNLRTLVLAALVGGLVMTQSRGPWVGMVLALIFALLVRLFSVGKAAVVFVALLVGLASVVIYVGNRYTQGTRAFGTSEEQASAIYRRQLLQTYTPVIKERMAFGWGFTDYPAPNDQKSIDNQFLWMAVTQGFVGLGIFFLIATGSAIRLLKLASLPLAPEDRMMVFAHIAVLMGLLTSLATVYMGEQVVMVFFMVIGWVQGMNPALADTGAAGTIGAPFRFRRVLV